MNCPIPVCVWHLLSEYTAPMTVFRPHSKALTCFHVGLLSNCVGVSAYSHVPPTCVREVAAGGAQLALAYVAVIHCWVPVALPGVVALEMNVEVAPVTMHFFILYVSAAIISVQSLSL